MIVVAPAVGWLIYEAQQHNAVIPRRTEELFDLRRDVGKLQERV